MKAPVLDAYRTPDGQLAVWCEHDRRWHWHGACDTTAPCPRPKRRLVLAGTPCRCPVGNGDGHRVAHCLDPKSPYDTTGYVIREVGPLTPAVRRAHKPRRTRGAR